MSILLGSLLLVGLPGCKDKAKKMSQYPYSLEKLDKRWGIARKSFQSDKPEIIFGRVLLKDLDDVLEAMQRTYKASNSDEVIAKLKELHRKFRADMRAMLDTSSIPIKLMPGVKVGDVGEAIDKAYAEYQEFVKLVK